jgi:hypothetical protein
LIDSTLIDLRLTDPAYTERLASFLTSLGQRAIVSGPATVELFEPETEGETARIEIEIYLRVWNVLYPEAGVVVAVK